MNETILQEADRLVSTDRQADYGHPFDNCTDIAIGWRVIFCHGITAENVALAMVWLKICRELNAHKRDNLVDGAGYFKVADLIIEERKRRATI
jgi:hypothetical protein